MSEPATQPTDEQTTVAALRMAIHNFVAARDWYQFHTPKHLAMSIAIEAAELMEHFQWLTVEESQTLMQNDEQRAAVADELADVLIYCLSFANSSGIDVSSALHKKLTRNEGRFPVEQIRGRVRSVQRKCKYIMIAQNATPTMPDTLARLVTRTVTARIPTPAGEFQLYHYCNNQDSKEHLAFVLGNIGLGDSLGDSQPGENILVHIHSECFTGDVLGSLRCDCGEQLHKAMQQIATAGRGVLIYLRQEGRGIGLAEKLKAYNLQDQGYDTVEANLQLGHQADEREYWCAAAILGDLGVRSLRLLTNNPDKIERLRALGVHVTTRISIEPTVTLLNRNYLTTKVQRMRHLLTLPQLPLPYANGSNGATDHAPTGDSSWG